MIFKTKHQKIKKNKKIGLALGGGAVFGAAHIGVLKALEEFEISVSYIAGTSIGAFVSAFYAFNKNWEEIEKIAEDLKWLDISGISLSKFGLLNNERLGKLIREHIGNKKLEQSEIPVAMVSTDISTGEKIVLREGNVAEAVMASTCIPGIFVPVEINDNLLVDGGIVENVPITPLKEMGANFIIGVDLMAEYKHKRPENIIEILLNAFDFTIISTTKSQTEEADLLIKPDLTAFNMVDTTQVADLIEEGYLGAKKVLKKLK
jgi:NTE family protein